MISWSGLSGLASCSALICFISLSYSIIWASIFSLNVLRFSLFTFSMIRRRFICVLAGAPSFLVWILFRVLMIPLWKAKTRHVFVALDSGESSRKIVLFRNGIKSGRLRIFFLKEGTRIANKATGSDFISSIRASVSV